jgi:hypothetical protein
MIPMCWDVAELFEQRHHLRVLKMQSPGSNRVQINVKEQPNHHLRVLKMQSPGSEPHLSSRHNGTKSSRIQQSVNPKMNPTVNATLSGVQAREKEKNRAKQQKRTRREQLKREQQKALANFNAKCPKTKQVSLLAPAFPERPRCIGCPLPVQHM